MELTIKFYKSSSKYYDTACRIASRFDSYIQEKSTNSIVVKEEDLRSKSKSISELLSFVSSWNKTEYFFDERKVSSLEMNRLMQVLKCEDECTACVLGLNKHCYDETGWGCKSLTSIKLRREQYYYSYDSSPAWYDFGHFSDNKWHIDKPKIIDLLLTEAKSKKLELCHFFDNERIIQTVNSLLDEIDVENGSEWEYKYRDAPIGMPQTEIIGIRPRRETSGSIRISIDDFVGNDEEEEDNPQNEKDIPDITFDDIGGIDDVVRQVREVIELPLIAPALFKHYSIKPHRGILLYGPPGCGKTMIAKAVANEIKAHFISVSGPEVLNKYVGQSEENLRKVFQEAKTKEPSVIYFDEFDSISATRDTDGNPLLAGVVNQLLTLMDGMDSSNKVCCIASTNRIDIIDAAIKRPGRFDYVIEIQKPSLAGCKEIFRIHTSKMPVVSEFNKDQFVEKYLSGCSGAEIAFVVSEAAYNSIRRTVNISQLFTAPDEYVISSENVITEIDFVNAAATLKNNRQRAATAHYRY